MTTEYDMSFTTDHRYTTNHDAIRQWAEARDAIPVSEGDGETSDDYRFVHRSDREDVDEEEAWDSFRDAFEDDDNVFVYQDQDPEDDEIDFHELAPENPVTESNARQASETQSPSTDR